LAGGGDPATSPLYVFGPFLKLVVVAGVAEVTFGASIWLVVLTIATVSAMYRLVMRWITDGSGGSGLSEEEFGGWAVKMNAAITFVEYTLTFLVSMAAMVTFIADRFPLLNSTIVGIEYRTFVAIALSILTGWLVNRGPKIAARTFGPATAGVLVLLWAMVFATIWRLGFHLPKLDPMAFSPQYINFTFAGYARILAVMTGIEVFANLVAAYEGTPEQKSNKAFGSLLIIMGTASVTMLVVGPAIFRLSDPTDVHVSVFTQAMDKLLPAPFPYLGTLVGVAVLLSASAASAQGLQNLALGLRDRHYIPDFIGRRNKFDVADMPVWIEVGICCIAFLAFGTGEETYLALYAAGVFILLSMTGWAAAKRLLREMRAESSIGKTAMMLGTIVAAILTSGATVIIFWERFREGVWTYFLFIPVLYLFFTYFRSRLGAPSAAKEQAGSLEEAMWGGFGFGQVGPAPVEAFATASAGMRPGESLEQEWVGPRISVAPHHIVVPVDGSVFAEGALPIAEALCQAYNARLTLLSRVKIEGLLRFLPVVRAQRRLAEASHVGLRAYLRRTAGRLRGSGVDANYTIGTGKVADLINTLVRENDVDMVVTSTHGRSGIERWLIGSVALSITQRVDVPVVLVRPTISGNGRGEFQPRFDTMLVPLDGSTFAEEVLPHVRSMAARFGSEVILLSVPEVPEAHRYGAAHELLSHLREKAEQEAHQYLEGVATALREEGLPVRTLVTGTGAARTILAVSKQESTDMIALATHGRGALESLMLGSVADRIVRDTPCPIFLVPVRERRSLHAAVPR